MQRLLVIGSALREVCGDQEQLGMRFLEEVRTAPRYRLYSLDGRWAALVEDPDRGGSVLGELVEIDPARWPEIVASEPPGVTPGLVELDDGRHVKAALGDPELMRERGVEITHLGSFAAYLREETSTCP
jgi:hypothetical protein